MGHEQFQAGPDHGVFHPMGQDVTQYEQDHMGPFDVAKRNIENELSNKCTRCINIL